MKVEILIGEITKLTTRTRIEEGLNTTIQFDAKISVASVARLLNLQRQGAPLLVAFSSPQATMDLVIEEDRGAEKAASYDLFEQQ